MSTEADYTRHLDRARRSKLLRHEKDHFAELAVNAVLRLKGKQNMDYIQARRTARLGTDARVSISFDDHSRAADPKLIRAYVGISTGVQKPQRPSISLLEADIHAWSGPVVFDVDPIQPREHKRVAPTRL